MELFILGLFLLVIGYFTYGKVIEKIVGPDDSPTPATTSHDGVDFLALPNWKNMLIQLLNIAGVGPVIGVILGVKFGNIVFLIIPIGNILAGAVHDYLAGMISIKNNGASLSWIIKDNLGKYYHFVFNIFMIALLLLVVAVFINVPSDLLASKFFSEYAWASYWFIGIIFLYYIVATLFPINEIIGRFYPYVGAVLIIGSLAIFVALMIQAFGEPSLLGESKAFLEKKYCLANNNPIIPVLFVTIACGIISGFHATQATIVSRTMTSQRQGRKVFYGMMVLEGFIAMVWAAAALAIYNKFPEFLDKAPTVVLTSLTDYFLGTWLGSITILAVVILAITSGDTAMRSMRLSIASNLNLKQIKISSRLIIVLPLIVIVLGLLIWSKTDAQTFKILWNYFAWGNQILAASTLMAAAVWLFKQSKNGFVALVPGVFMTFIVLSYILWISPKVGGPIGFGLDLNLSYILAGIITFLQTNPMLDLNVSYILAGVITLVLSVLVYIKGKIK